MLDKKRDGENRTLARAIVVLIRNTTWRCGRLERLIVKNLHRNIIGFGKREMPIKDMIQNFNVSGKKKSEFLDALRRLERRNIVRILRIVN